MKDGLCTKLTKLCLPVATQDSPFIKRKKDVTNKPPPVPLSPRPSHCLLSSNNVTALEKVREVCFYFYSSRIFDTESACLGRVFLEVSV